MGRAAEVRGVVDDVARRLREADGTFVAAGLTFYAAIAVVPLMLSALWLAGLLVGEDTVVRLVDVAIGYVPSELGLRRGVGALRDVGVGLGLTSFAAGLIPATTYGEGLIRAFDRLVPAVPTPAKSLRGRLRSAVLLATFPLLTVLGLVAVAVVDGWIGDGLGGRVLGAYLAFVFGWAGVTSIVASIYAVFGPREEGTGVVSLRPLLLASAAAGSFLSGMTLGWLAVLRIGVDVGAAYGGSQVLGSAVLVVVYLYLVQYVVLAGYVLAVVLDARRVDPRGPARHRRHDVAQQLRRP